MTNKSNGTTIIFILALGFLVGMVFGAAIVSPGDSKRLNTKDYDQAMIERNDYQRLYDNCRFQKFDYSSAEKYPVFGCTIEEQANEACRYKGLSILTNKSIYRDSRDAINIYHANCYLKGHEGEAERITFTYEAREGCDKQ